MKTKETRQRTTILGEHIDLIRPRKITIPQKDTGVWRPQINTRAKTRIIGVAEFFSLCLAYNKEKEVAR